MNTIKLLIVFLVAVNGSLFARLGESEQELVSRFGLPTSRLDEISYSQGKMIPFGSMLRFQQDDWIITCSVVEGRSAKESYSKPGEWTEAQIRAVLTSNAQGAKWLEISKDMIKNLSREWRREDSANAKWSLGGGMIVENPSYARAKAKAELKAKNDSSKTPKI